MDLIREIISSGRQNAPADEQLKLHWTSGQPEFFPTTSLLLRNSGHHRCHSSSMPLEGSLIAKKASSVLIVRRMS